MRAGEKVEKRKCVLSSFYIIHAFDAEEEEYDGVFVSSVLSVHDCPHKLLVVDVAVAVLVPGQQLLDLWVKEGKLV